MHPLIRNPKPDVCWNPAQSNLPGLPLSSFAQCHSTTPHHKQWQLSCPELAVQCDALCGKLSNQMILSHVILSWASHTRCAPLFFCFSLLTVQIIPPQKILSHMHGILIILLFSFFFYFLSNYLWEAAPQFLHILWGFSICLCHAPFSLLSCANDIPLLFHFVPLPLHIPHFSLLIIYNQMIINIIEIDINIIEINVVNLRGGKLTLS